MKRKRKKSASASTHRVILINGPEKKPMAAKKKRARPRRRAKTNPANPANPHKKRHRARRPNPRRMRRHTRRNPAGSVGRAVVMGLIGGAVSEAVDYGTDQISSFSPMAQAGTSIGIHVAAGVGAAFIDSHLLAGMVATTVKSASQRIRAQIALAPAKPATKPAVLKVGDTDPKTGKTITAIDSTTTPPTYISGVSGLGAFTTRHRGGGMGMAIEGRGMPSTIRGRAGAL